MFEHLNFRVNHLKADYSDVRFSDRDKEVLRELALHVAEIAARPVMVERKELWVKHNSLEKTRPLVLADPENSWNEIIRPEDMRCEHSVAQIWECQMRKHIFWGDEMGDDFVVEPYFNVPHVYRETPWGVAGAAKRQTEKTTRQDGGSYHIETVLEDYGQIPDITRPQLEIDHKTTETLLDIAHELFDGILEVRLNTVWFWSVGLTDDFVFMRGLERLMFDFYDEPDRVHEVMKLLFEGTMARLDYLENNGLLSLNNDGTFVGSGGIGYTRELPSESFDGTVRTKDMWGLGESQVTVGLSPEMFEEFIFPYQKPLMERFGLSCYGCCEPLDKRFDIVKTVPNLRRVSVSPWADKKLMADKLGDRYIYSMKANPSNLALPEMDEEAAREEIRYTLKVAGDTCLEIIMKDNHTLGSNPENIKNWVRLTKAEIGA